MEWTWPDDYDPAGPEDAGRAQPGLVALEGWLVDNRDSGHSGGIYNFRPVRGVTSPSVHGEGRALDWMTSGPDGDDVLDLLASRGRALGIQFIIWDRNKYGPRYPTGAPYGGAHPHTDHLHIEMTWAAARALDRATVDQIMEDAMPLSDADVDRIAHRVVSLLSRRTVGNTGETFVEVWKRTFLAAEQAELKADQILDHLAQ